MRHFSKMNLLRAGALLPAALLLSAATRNEPAISPRVIDSYGKLPLSFEANYGQTDPRVKFLSRGRGYTLFLTGDAAAVLSLHGQESNAVLRMNLRGANAHASVAGTDPLPGRSNYFVGTDPSQWRTNVPSYGAVKYTAVYPGIDLVYHGEQRLLEYDFVVAPGADPQAIDIRFQGAQKLTVNGDGALVIGIGGNEVIEHAPVVYQEIGGHRQTLAGRYVRRGRGRVGFKVAEYDRNHVLFIDPVLVYSTYLGAVTGGNGGNGIAVDASGNAYVTGATNPATFPTTPGAFQTTFGGGWTDAFVAKLNATGSALLYATYIGGSDSDQPEAIALDAQGNAYITGVTWSSDFPVTPGAFQAVKGGAQAAFVSKLNATGSALVYSTYLTGGQDWGGSIAVDTFGNAVVTGGTRGGFPTTANAFQRTWHGDEDVFVSKLNASGSGLVYSTYVGGSGQDHGYGVAVDISGNAYVTGFTSSSDFPTTPGAFQTTYHAIVNGSAFITKLNTTGTALVYSTYLGGSDGSAGDSIAVDTSGNAYVTGGTSSSDFPTTPGAFQTNYGYYDAFVSKLNAAGSALDYSTFLGGSTNTDSGLAIAVDASGNAYVTGQTLSSDFPTTPGSYQPTFAGEEEASDAFLTKLNASGSALIYSTYLGGTSWDEGDGIAVDASGNTYVCGPTSSADFPTTEGAFHSTYAGTGAFDHFVSKLSLGSFVPSVPVTTANLNGPSGSNGWYLGPITVTLTATPESSPVSATYYSIDGGSYQGYGAPFSISTDGIHRLLFYSVDTGGNQETPHGQTIKIDAAKPTTRVVALPATAASPNFSVQWSGTDVTSGLAAYTIYVSDNGGAFVPWLSHIAYTQAYYAGSLGQTYAFYSIATDNAGNQEHKTAPDATTHVPQMSGDVNSDGKIDCTDITLVKASFGKRTGQAGFDPRADLNGDGAVDVRDLAAVSQKLIPGTKCP